MRARPPPNFVYLFNPPRFFRRRIRRTREGGKRTRSTYKKISLDPRPSPCNNMSDDPFFQILLLVSVILFPSPICRVMYRKIDSQVSHSRLFSLCVSLCLPSHSLTLTHSLTLSLSLCTGTLCFHTLSLSHTLSHSLFVFPRVIQNIPPSCCPPL